MLGTATALYQQASANDSFSKLDGWPGTYEHVDVAEHSPRVAFTYSEVDKPTEVYLADSADQIGNAHADHLVQQALHRARPCRKGKPFRWTSDDGTKVEGELLYPPGKFEAKNLRTVRPDPRRADGRRRQLVRRRLVRLGACTRPANGWLVFRPNYRGSAGYGDKFALGHCAQNRVASGQRHP